MFTVRAGDHGIFFMPKSEGGATPAGAEPAFKRRAAEPAYAQLAPSSDVAVNQHGKPIELIDARDPRAGQSLRINGSSAVGANPDRYKQHGFHFTADNCIGCHACEAACSEKNALPAHISFRSVGYVEGGSYPDFKRVNISMACNHCDDPVCLKGCPTRAYTKFAEYGAVLQDPDICFGCGYCTWVCPYNAPQLDPIKGQVSKCNMCVDRLEVGLKPACAAACLAGALDFGVIENLPANRMQAKLDIPGFPDPAITHPNVRFQQTRELPREMLRTDSMPLVYVKQQDAAQVRYRSQAAAKPPERGWNLHKLRSREDPLVAFTLLTQAAVGAFLALFLGPLFGLNELAPQRHPQAHLALLAALIGMQALALALSTSHLGKPHRFYRGLYNLRYSPLSREAAAIGVFFGAMALHAALHVVPGHELARTAFGWLATAAGLAALYAMVRCYRIKARPFWDHWQVLTSFYGATLALGPLVIALAYGAVLLAQRQSYSGLLAALAWPIALGLALEGVGLIAHARYLNRRGGEAAASHLEQRTTFGMTYIARNAGLALSVAALAALGIARLEGHAGISAWLAAAALIVITALVGRALFYVLVIPTTMPGAFFWRNRAFEEHARKTGLAKMPQVGVLPDAH